MHKWSTYSLSLALLLFCWMPAGWTAEGWQPLADTIRKSERDTRQYQGIKLDNGMTVLLVSDPQAPKSLAALALPVGSLQDPQSQQGLAHYLEHMVLMGSQHYPEPDSFSEYLNKHGGSYNASTAPYRTAFYLEVENDAFKPAVDRLAGAIAEPLLDPLYADRERNAVNAELTMARSRDAMRMAQVDAETLNPAHPASQFFGGNLETLSDKANSKLQDELKAFYQRYYSANLMVGVLYSQQSLPQLQQLATDTFGRIANRQASVAPISVPAVTKNEQGMLIHYVPAQPRKLLRIDFRIADNSAEFRSKTDTYIGYLLSNRSENTLSDWLQKQGLADGISAGADPKAEGNGGVFRISVSLTDKGLVQRDQVMAAIFSYLKLMRDQGIRQDYFDEISHVLTLDFRYQSITRDMSYVESLSDTLLRTPIKHVLDADYLADRFDAKAIAARLDGMTPQVARVWYISPHEPSNKKAYFVEAAYQAQKINPAVFDKWRYSEAQSVLKLPELNPYIADNFDLIAVNTQPTKPEWTINEPGIRALQMPSRYFMAEPRVSIIVALRNADALDSARNQVLFSLTDYIAGLKLAQISYQASIGGISFSTRSNHGLEFSADGFTQRMPQLFNTLIEQYRDFAPTADELEQAKSWYREMLEAADKGRAYELAVQPIRSVSSIVPYFERDERMNQLAEITLTDINGYRNRLLKNATPEIISIGNLSAEQVKQMALAIKQRLGCDGSQWWHGESVSVEQIVKANLMRPGSSTDSALATFYVPFGYAEIAGMARSKLLAQIIHPWFYNQLRTEEQLGYALFAIPMPLGNQWGISFILQSNAKAPAYLNQRYLDFFAKTKKRLLAISEKDFEQYKQGMINELQQRPQTLNEEASRYSGDFGRSNYQFDARDKLIAELKTVTKSELYHYFKRAVVEQRGLSMLSQVMGEHDNKTRADYAEPPGWTAFSGAETLQKILPHQVRP